MKKIIFLAFIFYFASLQAERSLDSTVTMRLEHMPIAVMLAEISRALDHNMVLSSRIQGEVSVYLNQVSWQNALEVILKAGGLIEKSSGGVFYVMPIAEWIEREKEEQAIDAEAPIKMAMIRLNYAHADELAVILQDKERSMLSKHGSVSVDKRTNSIIVREISSKLHLVERIISDLDIPVSQVEIEAKIVNIDNDHEKDLGVRFGVSEGGHVSGRLKGANAMAGGQSPQFVDPLDRLNVNLPALNQNSAHLGIALFKLSKDVLLDLELSALESDGHAEVISNPHLVTSNQQSASIEAGEEIPYEEIASTLGATKTTFKKAVLKLKVTPQITPNRKIILLLQVNQDKRSTQEVKGVPTIDTRAITTQVVVDDGQTIVLGGIYESTRVKGVERVPFLADIPGLGVLFKRNKDTDHRRELLIFITPTIVGDG